MTSVWKTRPETILTVILGLLFLVAVPKLSLAQSRPPIVKARVALATDAVHPGSPARVAVVAEIAPGYHINAHHPSLNYLISTEVKFASGKTFAVDRISYPLGKLQKFAFAENGLSVYQGRLVIPALLRVAPGTAPGEHTLGGQLSYQACNASACFPPASAAFSLPVRVVAHSIPLKPSNPQLFGKHTSQ